MAVGRFAGRVAIVTGGAGGIGSATARRFVADGGSVVVMDVARELGEGLVRELAANGGEATYVDGDVASSDAWQAAVAAARALCGGVDCVVNNATAVVRDATLALTLDDWRRQLDVNLTAVFLAVQACMPELARRGGSMVNVSSIHARVGFNRHAGYDAAKGGITALTRQLAVEFGPRVRVNAVLPGMILTPIWDHTTEEQRTLAASQAPVARMGEPEEVAAAICFLASDDASFVNGVELLVDGGWCATRSLHGPDGVLQPSL